MPRVARSSAAIELCGAAATASAIKFEICANEIGETVYAFPTYSNDIKSMIKRRASDCATWTSRKR